MRDVPSWYRLLALLAPGGWVSGNQLAARLALSRAAVWKQVERLEAMGIGIQRRRGSGYRLDQPLELLSPQAVMDAMDEGARELLQQLIVLPDVDSSNSWLAARARLTSSGIAVLAERQTGGRGRRGRGWVSPLARNLYASVAWRMEQGLPMVGGLSLAAGVAAARALERAGAKIDLKWPNDLLLAGRKLGGILIEAQGEASGPCTTIIGFGINVAMDPGTPIGQAWTDLAAAGLDVSRNQLAGLLLSELFDALRRFEKEGLSPFLEAWRSRDALAGSQVTLELGGQAVQGASIGIDEQGRLLIETRGGVRAFAGGEVSVRRS